MLVSASNLIFKRTTSEINNLPKIIQELFDIANEKIKEEEEFINSLTVNDLNRRFVNGIENKFNTIKVLRRKLNISLKDAKDIVDTWQK